MPLFPVVPILSIVACGYILHSLRPVTWLVFAGWVLLFLIFYLAYGRRHSLLGRINAGEKSPGEDRRR